MRDSWNEGTYSTRDNSCVGSDIGIGSWNVSTYHMSMKTSANTLNSCLNIECGRDSASQLMHVFRLAKSKTLVNLFSFLLSPVCYSQSSCVLV